MKSKGTQKSHPNAIVKTIKAVCTLTVSAALNWVSTHVRCFDRLKQSHFSSEPSDFQVMSLERQL